MSCLLIGILKSIKINGNVIVLVVCVFNIS